MSTAAFVTCDLLDDHPELELQVVTPCLDGKFLRVMELENFWRSDCDSKMF